MYGIFTYIYPKNQPNVGKYAIHGASGHNVFFSAMIFQVTPMVAMVHGPKGDEHQCYVNENTSDAKPVGSPVVMWTLVQKKQELILNLSTGVIV